MAQSRFSVGIISCVQKIINSFRPQQILSHIFLQDVYNFVFCQPGSPDSFEITTNFPKRVLDTKDSMAHMTLASVGLRNREVLFVNDLDA